MTLFVKGMQSIAFILKETRLKAKLSLENVQKETGIDKALISKIERGIRLPTPEQLKALSGFYGLDYKSLKTSLFAQKIVRQIASEEEPVKILHAAEKQILYQTAPVSGKNLKAKITKVLSMDKRIKKAWLFGSWARNEAVAGSDIDLMIEYEHDSEISLFDEIEIQHQLSEETGFYVDLVEKDTIKPFAEATVEAEKVLIYNRYFSD
ncbi:MAG: nucleotidyltransferase domain-containing protein [Bacteroidales bacterium]